MALEPSTPVVLRKLFGCNWRTTQDVLYIGANAFRITGLRFLNGKSFEWAVREGGKSSAVREFVPEPSLVLSDSEGVVEAVLQGCGIGAVAIHHCIGSLRTGHMKIVVPELFVSQAREMAIQYPHRQYLPPRVKATLDFLYKAFDAHPDLHLEKRDLSSYWA